MSTEAQIHQGDRSSLLLRDDVFRSQWQALYDRCPWATVFQSLDYLETWYQIYHPIYEPVLVVSSGSCSGLTGLLPLAVRRSSRSLFLAGTPHAEYYGWLALPETSDTFIETALDSLRAEFPKGRLDFGFLPPDTPLGWLHSSGKWNRRCKLTSTQRPLLSIGDGSEIRESLRKKSNKSRLKRLERLGRLEFQRVRSFSDIESDFDEIISFCDLRQGAVHNSLPFRSDPHKKALFSTLVDLPELLHTTVWRLDGRVVSAHIGFCNRDQVSLGLTAHSPFFAEHSPGKLHMLLLGLLLAEEHVHELDLTPEGTYKDRFASHYDEVHRLRVFFSRTGLFRERTADLALRIVKSVLSALSISPQRAREVLARCQHQLRMLGKTQRPVRAIVKALKSTRSSIERSIFRLDPGHSIDPFPMSFPFKRDDVNDLLAYRPLILGDPPLNGFLSLALMRLEQGDHVYTYAKDGLLVHYFWLCEIRESSRKFAHAPEVKLPSGSFLIDEVQVNLNQDPQEWLRSSISHILMDLISMRTDTRLYALIPPGDTVCREVLAELGFVLETS